MARKVGVCIKCRQQYEIAALGMCYTCYRQERRAGAAKGNGIVTADSDAYKLAADQIALLRKMEIPRASVPGILERVLPWILPKGVVEAMISEFQQASSETVNSEQKAAFTVHSDDPDGDFVPVSKQEKATVHPTRQPGAG